jgi:hypothetical protein
MDPPTYEMPGPSKHVKPLPIRSIEGKHFYRVFRPYISMTAIRRFKLVRGFETVANFAEK